MSVRALLILCLASSALADLRMASQPRHHYLLTNQGTVTWNITGTEDYMHYRYMEPSHFNYAGLKKQKQRNYDNFLRSNIDNEQDNRNFATEDGKDHLPFRTYETSVSDKYYREYNRRRTTFIKQHPIELGRVVKPGDTMTVPLRWNNPHSSEMEVNIWIFEHASQQPIVVPIRKPSCSGEGYQDNVISFTVPKDFVSLGGQIPGFKGCSEDTKPMCVLQIYSHSVESRTYAIGFPIVIPGHDKTRTTSASSGIQDASQDPWFDLSGLRDTCLPATDPSAVISSSKPKWARLVSDVYNHAYQNSDYSPYSGQQQDLISKNLQASAINKMVTGNRGELGKSILPKDKYHTLRSLRRLESRIYKNYESLANKVIKSIGDKMKTTGSIGVQQLANCFRCEEVGSTNTNRLQTNTYIPSFQLPTTLIEAARKVVPSKYSKLITDSGLVQIYVASLNDLLPFFFKARELGITYQEADIKQSATNTKSDTTKFKKIDAKGKVDGGKYAALEAKKKFVEKHGCPGQCLTVTKLPPGFVLNEGKDCWKPCKRKGGVCDNFCGAGNLCCRLGYGKDPEACKYVNIKDYIRKRGHECVPPGPPKDQLPPGFLLNRGKNCWTPCKRKGGPCDDFCGKGNSCCRRGYSKDPAVCKNATRYMRGRHHECVSTVPEKPPVKKKALIAKSLVATSLATNITGPCAKCAQLFNSEGHPFKKPALTPLANSVAEIVMDKDRLPDKMSSKDRLPDNPEEGNIYESGNVKGRRRRRT